MKIGIIREGKIPPDRRVALTPQQCREVQQAYPQTELYVQPSPIRAYADSEYEAEGIALAEDLSHCDLLLGVKEVPEEQLIPRKTYLFFSHTYKKQPYNRSLLQAILAKQITLIDYELLKAPGGKRLLGFGRYAGIVGAYNAFRAWGRLKGQFELKPAHQCHNRRELEAELAKVRWDQPLRIALTGAGKVAMGAMEILSALKITQVFPKEYLRGDFPDETVFTQLDVRHYFKRQDGAPFTRQEFYQSQEGYVSNFLPYARQTDIFIAGHLWTEKSPFLYTREDVRNPDFKIQLVSDISADIDGPVATTLRPSTISEPFYAYDPQTEKEVAFGRPGSVAVSAVDNLPGELPRDASADFGNQLIQSVLPLFLSGDPDGILAGATQTNAQGELNPAFAYLQAYVAGVGN